MRRRGVDLGVNPSGNPFRLAVAVETPRYSAVSGCLDYVRAVALLKAPWAGAAGRRNVAGWFGSRPARRRRRRARLRYCAGNRRSRRAAAAERRLAYIGRLRRGLLPARRWRTRLAGTATRVAPARRDATRRRPAVCNGPTGAGAASAAGSNRRRDRRSGTNRRSARAERRPERSAEGSGRRDRPVLLQA